MARALWPVLAMVATFAFVVAIVAMHLLEPDLNSHSVSEYALGRYGWAIRIGFACLGIGLAALVLALRSALVASWVRTAGMVLLAIAGLGLIGIALFNTDPPGSKLTTVGFLHERFANIWSLSAALAMLVLGWAFYARDSLRRLRFWSVGLGGVTFVLWALGRLGLLGDFAVIEARLYFGLVVVWILIVAQSLIGSREHLAAPAAKSDSASD